MGTDAQGRTYLSYVVAVVEDGDWVATLEVQKMAYEEHAHVTLECHPDVSMAALVSFFAEMAESLTRLNRGDILPEFVDWGGSIWEAGDEGLPF